MAKENSSIKKSAITSKSVAAANSRWLAEAPIEDLHSLLRHFTDQSEIGYVKQIRRQLKRRQVSEGVPSPQTSGSPDRVLTDDPFPGTGGKQRSTGHSSDGESGQSSKLTLWANYDRENIHDIFDPTSKFTRSAGTWGNHGIVRLPDRPSSYVFIVTYGQEQAGHVFEESISRDGVLTWQSQPSQHLQEKRILEFISHDELVSEIYFFLRTSKKELETGAISPYTYLGTLSYLDHDPESGVGKDNPVWFHWQLSQGAPPAHICLNMNLSLIEGVETQAISPGLSETLPPDQHADRSKTKRQFRARKGIDFAGTRDENSKLGHQGELLVIEYEKSTLARAGREDLADRVRHISVEEGDGAGYDVLSFTSDGRKKFIEVKSTRQGKSTPFFMTANEVAFSAVHEDNFYLYRIYSLTKNGLSGEFWVINGSADEHFELSPTEYRVRIK